VRPLHRERLLRTVYDGLNPQGCLLLIEKVLEEETLINRLFVKHYYDFKRRNGYAEIEIAQKREALENVLIPYRLEENHEMLRAAGFRHPAIFFKWYNFCGILGVK
jgi:tRNA (cmo5U34)-methyltransferase